MTTKTIGQRIREWDAWVEDDGLVEDADIEERVKPFDAGIMLAVADVLDKWEHGDLAGAVRGLQETAEAVIGDPE